MVRNMEVITEKMRKSEQLHRKKQGWKKTWKKTSAFLLSCAVAMGIFPAVTEEKGRAEAMDAEAAPQQLDDTCNDDWLHTNGSDIVDQNGNVVRLTGANWFGFNCSECMLHGLWSADLKQNIKSIADRGFNLLRIPISTELLLNWEAMEKDPSTPALGQKTNFSNSKDYSFNPDLVNPDGTSMNPWQVFKKMMEFCKEYGVKVMVDVHSPDANNSGHNYPLWYGKETSEGKNVTTDMWIEGWKFLVSYFKNDDTFIACDLKNEPHGKVDEKNYAKWDDSDDENNWRAAAEKCGKAILEINPNMLIMVEGVEMNPKEGVTYQDVPIKNVNSEYVNFEGAWWGGNLRMAGKYPVRLGNQVVYSPHDYGPAVYAQKWFDKDFTEQTLLDDYWRDAWAYLVEENKAPLLMGEWGGYMDKGKNEKWLNLLADYMNKKNISHTFWCLNANSGDTGGLWDNTYSNWDEEKYALVEKTLWKDQNGRFVGLDHQKALGNNGITIEEFYHNTSNPVPVAVTGVTTDQTEISLAAGDSKLVQATITPANASNKKINWTSSDPKVATVSETGIVTGKTKGTAVITAMTEDGKFEAKCIVNVTAQLVTEPTTSQEPSSNEVTTPAGETDTTGSQPDTVVPVTRILLDENFRLEEGKSGVLKATIVPEQATNKVLVWKTNHPDVVKVENGTVTALKAGTAIVTVTNPSSNVTASCTVSVTPRETQTEPIATTRQEQQTSGDTTAQADKSSVDTVQTKDENQKVVSTRKGKKPSKVTGLKAKRISGRHATLVWKKQKGVSGYKIYLYHAKTRRFTYFKTTKKNSLYIKKLKKKTCYKVKVRAYKKISRITLTGACSKKLAFKIK